MWFLFQHCVQVVNKKRKHWDFSFPFAVVLIDVASIVYWDVLKLYVLVPFQPSCRQWGNAVPDDKRWPWAAPLPIRHCGWTTTGLFHKFWNYGDHHVFVSASHHFNCYWQQTLCLFMFCGKKGDGRLISWYHPQPPWRKKIYTVGTFSTLLETGKLLKSK